MSTLYAFCEPSWASTSSREHIRIVERGEVKLGGGIKTSALCGFDLAHGWDLPGDVTAQRVELGLIAECNPTCPDCARIWRATTTRGEQSAETNESEGRS